MQKHIILSNTLTCATVIIIVFLASCGRKTAKESIGNKIENIDTLFSLVGETTVAHPDSTIMFLRGHIADSEDSVYKAFVDVLMGECYYYANNLDSINYYFKRVNNFCARQKLTPDLYSVMAANDNFRGVVMQTLGIRDSSLFYYTRAYHEAKNASWRGTLGNSCINAADVSKQMGKLPEAAQWYRNALAVADSLKQGKLAIYIGLGSVYSGLGNFELADKTLDIAENKYHPGNGYERYNLYNEMGNNAYHQKKYDRALEYFKEAYSSAKKLQMPSAKAIVESNLGEIFTYLRQYDSARVYINSARKFFFAGPEDPSIKFYLDGLSASLELATGNLSTAKKYLSQPFDAKVVGPMYLSLYNKRLMEYYQKVGDYKNAWMYREKYETYRDSLQNANYLNSVAEIDMRYSKDTTVLHRDMALAKNKEKISKLTNTLIISGVLLLLLIAAAMLINFLHKEKRIKEDKKRLAQISNLRVTNLLSRFSPHFVFNVLNVITPSLQREQSGIVEKLISLLRYNLQSLDRISIKLQEELKTADDYAVLCKSMNKALPIPIHEFAPDVDMNFIIPAMCIQICVENAIKHAFPHGVAADGGDPKIIISGKVTIDKSLEIVIKDNGIGYDSAAATTSGQDISRDGKSTGNGIKILSGTSMLLNTYNQNKIKLSVRNDGGTVVTIVIPKDYKFNIS